MPSVVVERRNLSSIGGDSKMTRASWVMSVITTTEKQEEELENLPKWLWILPRKTSASPLNVTTIFIYQFVSQIGLGMMRSMTSYLLASNLDLTTAEQAKLTGNIGFASDVAMIACDLAVGYHMDKHGRKPISIVSFALVGLTLIAFPLSGTWIPGYYIVRVMFGVANLPSENSPFAIDYLPKYALGRFQAIKNVVTSFSAIIANSGSIYMQ